MGDLMYFENPNINSLYLLTSSHPLLATFASSHMFLKFICALTGNKNDLKFLSDWVAHQDFFMSNEFSLPQSFIISAIVSLRMCPSAFKKLHEILPMYAEADSAELEMPMEAQQLFILVSAFSWSALHSTKDNFCSRNYSYSSSFSFCSHPTELIARLFIKTKQNTMICSAPESH